MASRKAEWQSGWPLVLAGHVGLMAIIAHTYTIGIFTRPLAEEFGWSRGLISSSITIAVMGMVLLSPIVGGMVDRYGSRRVALVAAPLTGLSFAAVGLVSSSVWTWYAAWGIYSIVYQGIGALVWSNAVARHFKLSRGLAFALAFSGNGLGAMLWPPLAVLLIEHVGWRAAFMGLGACIGLLTWIVAFVFLRGPSTMPLAKEGTRLEGAAATGAGLREALGSTIFWRIALGLTVMCTAVASISVHLTSLLTDTGYSAGQAAAVLATFGPALIVGRLLGGVLVDKIDGRYLLCANLVVLFCACISLTYVDGEGLWLATSAAMMVGFSAGVEGDLLAYMLSRHFGVAHFARIYGAALSIFGVGYAVAPSLFGFAFDVFGSYDRALITLAVALAAFVPIALSIPRYARSAT